MAISFDDLIPGNNNTPGSAPAGGISFDDLIPKAAPGGVGQPPAQPEYKDSAVSIATQVPVGINDALATAAGFPVDATTWLLNRIPGVNIQDPVGGSGTFKKAMGLIGANPDDRQARTAAERIARAGGEGIGMMVAPEAAVGLLSKAGVLGGRALETLGSVFGRAETVPSVAANALIGGAGGATGGAAAEAVPEPYKPYAELGGNLVGGTAAALATAAPRVARDLFDLGARYIEPMTAAGRERIAGKQLSDSATSPYAVRDALEDLPREVVPGSQPTTFQLTGDMGLGALERDVATKNPADFMQRRADQNAARLDLMDTLQPKGSAADIPTLLRSSLKSLDDETQLAVNRALEGARNRTSQIGGTRAPEDYGIGLRSALQKAEDGARTRERGLWQAIDPDGTLTIDMSPVKKAAGDIYGNMSKASQTGLSPFEREVSGLVGGYRGVEPFRELADLRSAVSGAMRAELSSQGRTPAYARLSRLRGSIEDGIQNTAAQRAISDQQFATQFADELGGWRVDNAEAISRAGGREAGGDAPAGTAGIPGVGRAEGETAFRLPDAGGNQHIPSRVPEPGSFAGGGISFTDLIPSSPAGLTPAPTGPRTVSRTGSPLSLSQFIARNGGLELTGDAKASDFHKVFVPGGGPLARKSGRSIDGFWREKLIDAGYLKPDADGGSARDIRNELFELLQRERLGDRQFSVRDEDLIAARGARGHEDELAHEVERAVQHIREEAAKARLNTDDHPELYDAAEMMARGYETDWDKAFERAILTRQLSDDRLAPMAREDYTPPSQWEMDDALQRGSTRPVRGEAGADGPAGTRSGPEEGIGGPREEFPYAPEAGQDGALAAPAGTFDGSAVERLNAANAATRERVGTFGKGAVGQALRSQGMSGNYRLSDAGVPSKFFHSGPTGFEDVQAFRKAAGDPAASAMLGDYAAYSLRRAALRDDGTLDAAKFNSWKRSHAEALRAFPELEKQFGDAAKAGDAIAKATADRKKALDNYQVGVFGKLIGATEPDDVVRMVGGIFGQKNASATMGRLAREAEKNPAAKDGLRKAVAEYITGRYVGNTEAATSGRNLMKADAFQTFLTHNRGALNKVFTESEVKNLGALAMDLKRANRSITAVKLPGQSNTAQDIKGMVAEKYSWLRYLMREGGAGATVGFIAGGPMAAAAGGALSATMGALRDAGIRKADDLVKAAMLNPDLAAALLRKVPDKITPNAAISLTQRLKRLAVIDMAEEAGREMLEYFDSKRGEQKSKERTKANAGVR